MHRSFSRCIWGFNGLTPPPSLSLPSPDRQDGKLAYSLSIYHTLSESSTPSAGQLITRSRAGCEAAYTPPFTSALCSHHPMHSPAAGQDYWWLRKPGTQRRGYQIRAAVLLVCGGEEQAGQGDGRSLAQELSEQCPAVEVPQLDAAIVGRGHQPPLYLQKTIFRGEYLIAVCLSSMGIGCSVRHL